MILRVFVWILAAAISIVAATACTLAMGQEINAPESAPAVAELSLTRMDVSVAGTATPTIALPDADPLPHRPYEMRDISCYDMIFGAEDVEHWADELSPGESALAEFERLASVSVADGSDDGYWEYRDSGILFQFQNGILIAKSDPRSRLGDIVLKYGEPEQVIWHIPRRAYHLAKYDTILLFPEAGALFYTEEQVTDFGWATEFEYSLVIPPSEFAEIVNQYTSDAQDDYQFFPWPCDDSG